LEGLKMEKWLGISENVKRVNKEIDKCKMAYKVMDKEGNLFVFSTIENGHPLYKGDRGCKHIFQLDGLAVVQKYMED
jgi:hypothetical protein